MLLLILSLFLIIPAWYLAKTKPVYSLAIIIIGLPSFLIRWTLEPIGFNTLDLLITGVFIIFLIKNLPRLKQWFNNNKTVVTLLSLWLFVSIFAVFVPSHGLAGLGILKSYFIVPLLFVLMALMSIKTKYDLKIILGSLVILGIYISLTAFLQKIYPDGINGWLGIPNPIWKNPATFRATGLLEYPNALGLILAPLVPLIGLAYILATRRLFKFISLISLFSSLGAIYLAKSKGAILALILTLGIALVYYYRKKALMAVLALIIIFLFLLPDINYLINLIGPNSYSAQLRFSQWQETQAFLKDNPITAAGLNGFQGAIAPYHTKDYIEIFLYPHNIFLNFWVELGLAGLILFIFIGYYTLKQSLNILKTYSQNKEVFLLTLGGASAFIIIIIHGMVDVPYFKNDLAVIFWLIWSWPFIIRQVFTPLRRQPYT